MPIIKKYFGRQIILEYFVILLKEIRRLYKSTSILNEPIWDIDALKKVLQDSTLIWEGEPPIWKVLQPSIARFESCQSTNIDYRITYILAFHYYYLLDKEAPIIGVVLHKGMLCKGRNFRDHAYSKLSLESRRKVSSYEYSLLWKCEVYRDLRNLLYFSITILSWWDLISLYLKFT